MEYYCTYQERCHREVENKMRAYGIRPRVREKILAHLTKHHFLDEERFSKSFARGKFRIKNWGKRRIASELYARNIADHHIQEALKEIQEEDYLTAIEKITSQKKNLLKEKDPLKQKQKIYDYLHQKGFESNLIQEVIKKTISN